MTEEAPVKDEAGLTRTSTGDLANQSMTDPLAESNQNTTQETPKRETLLNQTEEKKDEKVETATDGDKAKTESKAPEKYEDYKVPEGYVIDPKVKEAADALFKGMGLTQEQAQQLVDFQIKNAEDAGNAPYEAWDNMKKEWRQAAESHPDLKGKIGPTGDVTVRVGKFLNSLDPQLANDFRDLMELTGAGDHPAFIRVIDYAAKKLTESGAHVAGNGPAASGQSAKGEARQPSAAEAMWPNLAQ